LSTTAEPLTTAAQAAAPASAIRRLGAALRVIHPFPTLLNVAVTAGLAAVAVDGWPDGALLARMMLMMFFAQSTIGATNDIFDRDLDALSKPWKPLPSGALSMRSAGAIAGGGAAATITLAATLGAGGFSLGLLGLACGLAYDAGFKRSRYSAVPFMVAIPTLPLWVWICLDRYDAVLWWIVPLGALIGLSLHLANTLPDIASDAAFGVRGVAHRLGERASKRLAWMSFGAAVLLAALLSPVVTYDRRIFVPTIALAMLCVLASIVLGASGRGARLQAAFGVMSVGAATAAVGWLAAAT